MTSLETEVRGNRKTSWGNTTRWAGYKDSQLHRLTFSYFRIKINNHIGSRSHNVLGDIWRGKYMYSVGCLMEGKLNFWESWTEKKSLGLLPSYFGLQVLKKWILSSSKDARIFKSARRSLIDLRVIDLYVYLEELKASSPS